MWKLNTDESDTAIYHTFITSYGIEVNTLERVLKEKKLFY